MQIVSINACNYGSTGKIMFGISNLAIKNGIQAICAIPKSRSNAVQAHDNQIYIGNRVSRNIHLHLGKIFGKNEQYSYFDTRRFLYHLKKLKPNLIHIHNLHGSYINIPLLFDYIKKNNTKVVWTLHDCWSFTGRCPHFEMAGCYKWIEGCSDCPYPKADYPASRIDRTDRQWRLKKQWFTGVKNLTVVTPSAWLAGLVKQSFLKEYPVKIIHNGIDLSIFKPTESDFRKKYGCEDKFVILGVAFGWGIRKGLDVFLELYKRLDERFQIVLVGTDAQVDEQLPEGIISIHRTQDQKELAEIYTVADLFVNPTREDNFPTVNMESIACGTPVITFNTGGSPEIIDETCGMVVEKDDVDAMLQGIMKICETKPYSLEACLKKSKEFDMRDRFEEYVQLYENLSL